MQTPKKEQPRKIVPPVYMLSSIILMVLLDWLVLPGMSTGPLVWGFGGSLISCGILLDIYCALMFKKADTGIVPFHEATAIVDTGPYKITRNPMYLGMVLIQLGVVVILGSIIAILPLGLFILIIQKHFIEGEERFMEASFGEQYLEYKKRVRRWI